MRMISVSQMGEKAMTPTGELFAAFDVVEKFAIEDNKKVAGFIAHRLLPVGQTDDAQATGSEGNPGAFEKAFLIRAAMSEGARHALHDAFWRRALPDEIDNACDAAHEYLLSQRPPR
jgi:hypothetical protein